MVPVPTIPFEHFITFPVRVSQILVVLHWNLNLSIVCGTAVINEQNGLRRDKAARMAQAADNLIYRHEFWFSWSLGQRAVCTGSTGRTGQWLSHGCSMPVRYYIITQANRV